MALLTFDKAHATRRRISIGMVLVAALLYPLLASHAGYAWVRIADMALLYIMLALGLNIIVGFTGLLDFGYIAFFAVGAYTTAAFSSPQFAYFLESVIQQNPALGSVLIAVFGEQIRAHGIHLSVWMILPISILLSALFGLLRGIPTLRLRGDYLAIVTLGFGEIVRIFMANLDMPYNITNGPQGINMVDPIRVFGVSLAGELGSGAMVSTLGWQLPSVSAYYYLFFIVSVVMILISVRLHDSRLGRSLLAIREDEIAAQAMGINTSRAKLVAFAVGGGFAGVAGAMFAAFQGFVSPESFTLNESILVLAMVVLGGIGHIPGVILGGLLLAALPEVLRHVVEPLQMMLFDRIIVDTEVLRQLMYGLSMVGIMLWRPAGLWPVSRHADIPPTSTATS